MVVAKKRLLIIVIALWTSLHTFGMTYCFEVCCVSEPDGGETVAEIKTPVLVIDSVQFANIDKKGRVIDDYGEQIEGSRVKYLAQRISYRTAILDSLITLDVKYFNPQGELMCDADSPEGCSFRATIQIGKSDENRLQYLGKLKSKFGKGYRMEIYNGPVCLISIPVPTLGLISYVPIMARTNSVLQMTDEYRRYLRMSPDQRKIILKKLHLRNYTGLFMGNYIITGWRTEEK